MAFAPLGPGDPLRSGSLSHVKTFNILDGTIAIENYSMARAGDTRPVSRPARVSLDSRYNG